MSEFKGSNELEPVTPIGVRKGRPRSERARIAILHAAISLLSDSSIREIAIENIARQAGASKVTIYRWWPDKTHLFIDAFLEFMAPKTSQPRKGAKLSDLINHFNAVVEEYQGASGVMISQIIAECQYNKSAHQYFLDKIIRPRRTYAFEIVTSAKASGEISSDVDTEILIDMLFGPIYFRMLIGHRPLDDAFSKTLAEQFTRLVSHDTRV